jgi:hypothetical protein
VLGIPLPEREMVLRSLVGKRILGRESHAACVPMRRGE